MRSTIADNNIDFDLNKQINELLIQTPKLLNILYLFT